MTAVLSTLPGALRGFANSRPSDVALRDKQFGIWREISWNDYWMEVAAVGHGLDRLGVEAGDHVAILADNRPEWLYVDLATQGLGGRSVGIYQTNTAEDVAYVINHSGARIVFAEDQEQADKI